MYRLIFVLFACYFSSCASSVRYYIVRHAEKEAGSTMNSSTVITTDVPLSEEGKKRAEALKDQLKNKKINAIYSTNTIRTRSTAEPLSFTLGVPINIYKTVDSSFVRVLKNSKINILIVGHSNTVDDLVNALMEKNILNDLPDAKYGDLFIVHKNGKNITYNVERFE